MEDKHFFKIFVGLEFWGAAPAIGSAPAIALAQAIERSTRGMPSRGAVEIIAGWLGIPFARIETGGAITLRVDRPQEQLASEGEECQVCGRHLCEDEVDDAMLCSHCQDPVRE